LGAPSPAPVVVTPVNGGTVSYASSDATKVAVDTSTGALEIHAVTGSTPVTITATESAAQGYAGQSTSYQVEVTAAPVSAVKSELAVETASPVAHSPVTVRLKLKDARNQLMKGKTGLTLTGTGMATAPAFAEDSANKGEYTASFTPADAKAYTLGVAGLTGFTKTVDATTAAA
ncbi:hypothetical protein, partial [Enterobacter sp. A103]|uniref:hypothetical protein n=1 Tax=Enterobacter sp. A103 TaxID=3102785 RepID=UPI002ACAA1E2